MAQAGCFFIVGFLALGLNLSADGEENKGSVSWIHVGSHAIEKSKPELLWGVSGSKIPVVLSIVAPLGSTCSVDSELLQVADELAVPVSGGGRLVPEVSFAESTFRSVEVPITLPEVERETLFLLRLSVKSTPEAKWLASTNVSIRLVPGPESRLNPLNRLRRLPEGTLLVTGESSRLRSFFDQANIPYVDGLEVSPSGSSVVLCEGNNAPPDLPSGLPLILFSESARKLPGVYSDTRSGFQKTVVTLPILPSLSTDVSAQLTLAELIFSSLPPNPNTEP